MGVRWPCPAGTDPDRYDARLRMLMRDSASINPALLRKAGDRLATRCKWLPTAAEIHEAVAEELNERETAQRARQGAEGNTNGRSYSPLAEQLRQQNLKLITQGAAHRWIIRNGNADTVTITQQARNIDGTSRDSNNPRCDGNGDVLIPAWAHRDGTGEGYWKYPPTPNGLRGGEA